MTASGKEMYLIEGISKVFGNNYVFNDVSFSIHEGEIFGIIGGSGSGKSTLLNLLVGFIKPEKGDIKFRDSYLPESSKDPFVSVFKKQSDLKKLYGFASQSPSFYPSLTVLENLLYFGALYNLSKESALSNAEQLLGLMDLTHAQHTLAAKLSGGMQRRLDIACSLIHDPKILILDEPTADLDPILSSRIWELLTVINQRGTTVIVASHELSHIESACTRIAIIKDARIAALGKPSEIKLHNACHEQIYLRSSPGDYKHIVAELKRSGEVGSDIKQVEIKDKMLVLHTKRAGEVLPALIRAVNAVGEKLINIESVKPSLDHVFKKITEELEEGEKKRKQKKGKKRKRK